MAGVRAASVAAARRRRIYLKTFRPSTGARVILPTNNATLTAVTGPNCDSSQ